MKKRSPSFPSKTIPEATRFSISIFEKVGETLLTYADLAKKGEVALREADNFAVTSSQYGFMRMERGKGYGAVGKICSALRLPKDGEENTLYLNAFTSPSIYKTIISLFNGKKITEQGLVIDLIRDHEFGDTGAKIAAKVFLDNASFLGLIDSDGVLNVNAEIKIEPLLPKGKKNPLNTKAKANEGKLPLKSKPTIFKDEGTSHVIDSDVVTGKIKNISIFIQGRELHFPVLDSMSQADWDAVIKQLQNIKTFSR